MYILHFVKFTLHFLEKDEVMFELSKFGNEQTKKVFTRHGARDYPSGVFIFFSFTFTGKYFVHFADLLTPALNIPGMVAFM